MGGQLQFQLLQQEAELGFGLGIAGEHQLAASVVGRCTSIICTAANFSSTLRGVSPGASQDKRKALVWEIERKLAEDGVRTIIFYAPARKLPAARCEGADDHEQQHL